MFNDFLRLSPECFKGVSREFQENYQGVSKNVLCCMALIAASRAEGGLVEKDSVEKAQVLLKLINWVGFRVLKLSKLKAEPV